MPAGGITLPLPITALPIEAINVLLLWGEAMAKDYVSNKWMTTGRPGVAPEQTPDQDMLLLIVFVKRS